jgi:DNA repair photolyase
MAIRFKRKTALNWALEEVIKKKVEKDYSKIDGTIMFPSSHDITPAHIEEAMTILRKVLFHGNNVMIVTKPHLVVVQKLCKSLQEYRDQILFRFTVGSKNNDTLKFWEPHAPDFHERLECLKYVFGNEYRTSVSCEPVLDTETKSLVDIVFPYVNDSIWIGKPNFLLRRLKMNGYGPDSMTFKKARELINQLDSTYFFSLERDVRGYKNIKWKESVKKVLGLEISQTAGMDL